MNGFLGYFNYFQSYLGKAIFVAFSGSMVVALLDGIGLTMFIPLLQQISGATTEVGGNLGKLDAVVDWLEEMGVVFTLKGALLTILFFFCAKALIRFVVQSYEVRLNQRFAKKMRLGNLELLADYDYTHFAGADVGEIQNSFNAEIGRIHQAYMQYFLILKNAAMALVYIGLAYLANPGFALLVAALGFLSNLLFKRLYRITKKASAHITTAMNGLQGLLIQSVNNFKYLKATGLIDSYKSKVGASITEVEHQQQRVGMVNALATAVREPLVIGLVVMAILVQVTYFDSPFSELLLSLLFFYRGLSNVVGIQNSYSTFLGYSGSIDGMIDLTERMRTSREVSGGELFKGLHPGMAVKDLSFSYGHEVVLDGLSFEVPQFTTLGIAGESGVGKTTLTNLLVGLYRAAPGSISVGSQDITNLDLSSYRRAVGYVTQEPPVFSDSIFNNVSFWDADTPANREKAWRALITANAADFVEELPEGLDEKIGINGLRLSGGQRQRLAIAREVYREVELLLLDEATASLDSISEQQVRDNLSRLAGKYTMIVVAHRLSTIMGADQILYLEKGGGYQIGTFAALLASSPGFKDLVKLQTVN